jgi:hypothetical protein
MRNRLLSYYILILFVLLIPACSVQNSIPVEQEVEWVRHDEWSEQTTFANWGTDPAGLAVGFVRPELRDVHPSKRGEIASNDKFHLEAGESFSTYLILSTGYDEPYPVLLSAVLDYRQVPLKLDGDEGLLHYLEVEPGVDMEIPLEVAVEEPGWHDFFIVAFRLPEAHPTEPDDRLPPSFGTGGTRTVLCVETCEKPKDLLPPVMVGQGTTGEGNTAGLPLLPDDGRPANQRLLLVETAEPDSRFPLELWVENGQEQAREFVLIPFLNFQQVPFDDISQLHVKMPPHSTLLIPGNIELPAKPAINELQIVAISAPYQPLNGIDRFIHSAMRAAIITGNVD